MRGWPVAGRPFAFLRQAVAASATPRITTVLAGIGVARELRVRPDPFRLRSADVLTPTGA